MNAPARKRPEPLLAGAFGECPLTLAPCRAWPIMIGEASETSQADSAPVRLAVFLCPHAWIPSMAWRGGEYPNTRRRS